MKSPMALALFSLALLACRVDTSEGFSDDESLGGLRVEHATPSSILASYASEDIGVIKMSATFDEHSIESHVFMEDLELAIELHVPYPAIDASGGVDELVEAQATKVAAQIEVEEAVVDGYASARDALLVATAHLENEPIRYVFHYHASVLSRAGRLGHTPAPSDDAACIPPPDGIDETSQCRDDLPSDYTSGPRHQGKEAPGEVLPGCSGSALGCCGNYWGPCLYSHPDCLAHDFACWDCQEEGCGSGCVAEEEDLNEAIQSGEVEICSVGNQA